MLSNDAQNEIEEYLGTVPSFIAELADPAAEHSWGILRDFELGETELSAREKALVGLGAAAAIQCPYCVRFHRAEAKMGDVTREELAEVVNLSAGVRYFSTVLHGAEIDTGDFSEETAGIVDHVEAQRAAKSD